MDISPSTYVLIGDLVGSRRHPDRAEVQRSLGGALDAVNANITARQPLEPTLGDEFQGAYDSLGDVVLASVLVRLFLPEAMDCRAGLGHGRLAVFAADRSPVLQDGPAWWAARDAIREVASRAQRARFSFLRTWYFPATDSPPEGATDDLARDSTVAGPVNAFLLCRDQMVARLSVSSRTLLRHTLLGSTQEQMAEDEGISQSAVSQRLSRSGVQALKEAHDVMTA
jgi:hypothetical protein